MYVTEIEPQPAEALRAYLGFRLMALSLPLHKRKLEYLPVVSVKMVE
jgi:hypothetical protein